MAEGGFESREGSTKGLAIDDVARALSTAWRCCRAADEAADDATLFAVDGRLPLRRSDIFAKQQVCGVSVCRCFL